VARSIAAADLPVSEETVPADKMAVKPLSHERAADLLLGSGVVAEGESLECETSVERAGVADPGVEVQVAVLDVSTTVELPVCLEESLEIRLPCEALEGPGHSRDSVLSLQHHFAGHHTALPATAGFAGFAPGEAPGDYIVLVVRALAGAAEHSVAGHSAQESNCSAPSALTLGYHSSKLADMETVVGSSRHWESALEPAVVVGQAVAAMVAGLLVGYTAEPVVVAAVAAVAADTPEADCVLDSSDSFADAEAAPQLAFRSILSLLSC
jgi:hypothetical protein